MTVKAKNLLLLALMEELQIKIPLEVLSTQFVSLLAEIRPILSVQLHQKNHRFNLDGIYKITITEE